MVRVINYVFPGSVFVTAHSSKKILRGLNPGQPKQCGLEMVDSSHFPAEWQGNLITNDFRGHRVNRFVISESGSGYVFPAGTGSCPHNTRRLSAN